MLLTDCKLHHVLKYIALFDEEDKKNEGVSDKTMSEIIDQYIESFEGSRFFEINEGKGFVILEKQEKFGGFHLFLKKEFRNIENARELLNTAIEKLKELNCEKIYTLANETNRTLLRYTKKFSEVGEYKGFVLYALK